MAGGGQQLGNALVKTGVRFGGSAPQTGSTVPSYVAPSQLSQGPSLSNPFTSGGMGVADYNPTATGNSGIFSGGPPPTSGQMNWQLTDAQKANLLAQQAQRDQQVQRAQMAPQMAPQISPFAQQMMMRSMAPQPIMGLPAALMQMQGRLNQPMMRAPMPMYQNPALGFRPNMAPAMEALNRVQPSVYKTDLDAARARIAELEAVQQPQNTSYYSDGG